MMDEDKVYTQHLLVSSEEDREGEEDGLLRRPSPRITLSRVKACLLTCLLTLSLAFNIAQTYEYALGTEINSEAYRFGNFSGLPYDTIVKQTVYNEFWNPDTLSRDEMNLAWDTLDLNAIAVALSPEWARDRGLPSSDRFPWDDSKGLYYIKAFHDLHCVRIVRQAWLYEKRREPFTSSDHHVEHCFDVLRQDIMCTADDTPLRVDGQTNTFGGGQSMKCRNWDKLVEWARQPERNGCFNKPNDYLDIKEPLELYGHCPEDSIYSDVVKQYFEKFGHAIMPTNH